MSFTEDHGDGVNSHIMERSRHTRIKHIDSESDLRSCSEGLAGESDAVDKSDTEGTSLSGKVRVDCELHRVACNFRDGSTSSWDSPSVALRDSESARRGLSPCYTKSSQINGLHWVIDVIGLCCRISRVGNSCQRACDSDNDSIKAGVSTRCSRLGQRQGPGSDVGTVGRGHSQDR